MNHQSCVQILNLFLAWYGFTRGDNIQLTIIYYKGLLGNAFLKTMEITGTTEHPWCTCAHTNTHRDAHRENYFKSLFLKFWSKSLGSYECNGALFNYLTARFFLHKTLPHSVHAPDLLWVRARLCQKATAVWNYSASGNTEISQM